MGSDHTVVVGAGVGGLAAAIDLAALGLPVTVVERAAEPGGKLRRVQLGDAELDAGPTVLTLLAVFEELFADAGGHLTDHVTLIPAATLARHAWPDGSRLDLAADPEASAEAIATFAGGAEAQRFRAFSTRAAEVYRTLEHSFIRAPRPPNPVALAGRVGLGRLGDLRRIQPFTTLWQALGKQLQDPRLRQLFGRYATYCGSSPFAAPATLMLVTHVEQRGVWLVAGGLYRLASAMAELAQRCGARIRLGTEVRGITTDGRGVTGVTLAGGEQLAAGRVLVNADTAALAAGRLGEGVRSAGEPRPPARRSLSAITWNLRAQTRGLALSHHNVFFSRDYRAEFRTLFDERRPPAEPTVYVCAQDRDDAGRRGGEGPERLLCLINAPADGDTAPLTESEIERCEERTLAQLTACGLEVSDPGRERLVTTPADFERLFPATGGALYGTASHGWTASFRRPPATTRIPGLYLAGGSTHPGPGLPMATLSGRLAARQLLADLTSPRRSRPVAMSGGTSTR